MASFTMGVDQRFRAGTVLNAYPATGGGKPTSVTATATATVASNSTATFAGLVEGGRYVAGTSPAGPFLIFSVTAPIDDSPSVSVATLGTALNDVLETEEGWPDRPTLSGEQIPWSLRWRSLPGSVTNPADKMAEFDTFLPVPEA